MLEALLQGGWRPVAAVNAHDRIAVDLLVAFVNVGGGSGGEARERACSLLFPLRWRQRRRSKGAGVIGPREQNTTAQFARRLLPQASAARATFRTCGPAAAGIGLGVHACGRSGVASSSPSPSPSRSRSQAAGAPRRSCFRPLGRSERFALAMSGRGAIAS
eukprot:tig00020563_g11261.t1